ncbi:hypothetical protein BKA70DRAFT_1176807 [Coprinopsis sp. MPI-PUGE-AT-0042]|nr:hypothetical protein BKA70DRAFT_1176807 [Coprinopsis sp. MPI-PUGE-AT-0042]
MQLTQLFTLVALTSWGFLGGLASPIAVRPLEKRVSNSKWSFYDAGLGACGTVNSNDDFIVALNAEDFGDGYPGPHCGKTITLSFGGKTAQAKIMDRCPGCPKGGLDLSRGLFSYFASQDTGIIYGEWNFGGEAPAPSPTPTPTPQPPAPSPTPSSSSQPAPSSSAVQEPPAPSPSPSSSVAAPAPSSSAQDSSPAPSAPASSSLSPVAPAPTVSSASPVAPSPSPSPASSSAAAPPSAPSPAPVQDGDDQGEYDDEDCEEWEYYDDEEEVPAPVAQPPAAAPSPAAPVQHVSNPSYNTAPANDAKAPSPAPVQVAPVNVAPAPNTSTGEDSVEKQIEENMNMISQLLNKLADMVKSLMAKSQKDA